MAASRGPATASAVMWVAGAMRLGLRSCGQARCFCSSADSGLEGSSDDTDAWGDKGGGEKGEEKGQCGVHGGLLLRAYKVREARRAASRERTWMRR